MNPQTDLLPGKSGLKFSLTATEAVGGKAPQNMNKHSI